MTNASRSRLPCALAMLLLVALTGRASAADYFSMSGKQLYERFCAACHGVTGAGDGPVSASLSVEVPDLRAIARRRGGRFPRDLIVRIVDGRQTIGAHGSRAMPVWGEDLGRSEIGNPEAEAATQTIIDRMVDYVVLLQLAQPGAGTGR